MEKLKRLLKRPRIIFLLVVLLMSIVVIQPKLFVTGVAIRSVAPNSSAANYGFENPDPISSPMSREVIYSINNIPIESEEDYYDIVNTFTYNLTVEIKTSKGIYQIVTKPIYKVDILDEMEEVQVEKIVQEPELVNCTTALVNKTIQKIVYINLTVPQLVTETELVNESVNCTEIMVNKTVYETEMRNKVLRTPIGTEDIGLTVYPAPSNNIKMGLDLAGGTRAILKPEDKLDNNDFELLISRLKQRLNVFGLTDIVVRKATDLSGNDFVLVEIAGAKEDEVRQLLSGQGKFEAKIGNTTVFLGGERDVTYVCRTPDCSGIDPRVPCGEMADGNYMCRFRFAISLSSAAAKRQAEATANLDIIPGKDQNYLSMPLDLYLDDNPVSSLQIGEGLKGKEDTDIEISGSGVGASESEAALEAINEMKRLQTVLITGSLKTKVMIEHLKSISPTLGAKFVQNAINVGLLAIASIFVMVYIRYRRLLIAIPILITLLSEVIIVMGFAALIGWNIDLAAIAGLIIVIGTSVDHQIVITDEILRGESSGGSYNWADRIKKAFFIIMGAYFTTLVAMLPLIKAGAGILRGFAITTIIGITIGVLIARPAFAAMVEILIKE